MDNIGKVSRHVLCRQTRCFSLFRELHTRALTRGIYMYVHAHTCARVRAIHIFIIYLVYMYYCVRAMCENRRALPSLSHIWYGTCTKFSARINISLPLYVTFSHNYIFIQLYTAVLNELCTPATPTKYAYTYSFENVFLISRIRDVSRSASHLNIVRYDYRRVGELEAVSYWFRFVWCLAFFCFNLCASFHTR